MEGVRVAVEVDVMVAVGLKVLVGVRVGVEVYQVPVGVGGGEGGANSVAVELGVGTVRHGGGVGDRESRRNGWRIGDRRGRRDRGGVSGWYGEKEGVAGGRSRPRCLRPPPQSPQPRSIPHEPPPSPGRYCSLKGWIRAPLIDSRIIDFHGIGGSPDAGLATKSRPFMEVAASCWRGPGKWVLMDQLLVEGS